MQKLVMDCLQIVGYKNSGKTTLVSELVKAFSRKGFKVSTLKHHGHGGKPQEPEGVDTSRHLKAGAIASGVEGGGTFQWNIGEISVESILEFYQLLPQDLLLIEGYKNLHFPKIVIIKEKSDFALLDQLSKVRMVIVWDEQSKELTDFPVFSIDEKELYCNHIINMAERGEA